MKRLSIPVTAALLLACERPTEPPGARPVDAGPASILAPGYEVVDLGGATLPDAAVLDINNAGQVIGNGGGRAFVWQNGVLTVLTAGLMTGAGAISETGVVVGSVEVAPFSRRPFVWQGGVLTELALPPGFAHGAAGAVSDNGTYVAGFLEEVAPPGLVGVHYAVRWDAVNGFSVIPLPFAGAHGVNNSGVVAGNFRDASSNFRAFVWEPGSLQTIGPENYPPLVGNFEILVWAINNAGRVLVSARTSGQGSDVRSFVWQGGVLTPLAPLAGLPVTFAAAINDAGDVVGLTMNLLTLGQSAVLWRGTDYANPIDLGTVNGLYNVASALSEPGPDGIPYIVGESAPDNEFEDAATIWHGGPMLELPLLPGPWSGNPVAVNDLGVAVGYVEDVTNADQKAVLWRLSTQGQIDFLQDDVASVTGTTGGPLNATLGAAESALAKGNRTAACNQLQAFINQVNAEIRSGRLDPDVGADWIARAQNAIDQLCP